VREIDCSSKWGEGLARSRELLQALINLVKKGLPRPAGTKDNDNSPHTEANLRSNFEKVDANGATLSRG